MTGCHAVTKLIRPVCLANLNLFGQLNQLVRDQRNRFGPGTELWKLNFELEKPAESFTESKKSF